jgi:Aldo/keto reductases, related to diketogulonate reductase
VTTKLAAECKSYAEAKERIDGSLKALGFDHIDLMLIHSPQPWSEFREGGHFFEGNLEAWRALEEAHQAGKLRAIGVSNFERPDLDNILDHGSVAPAVNQILAHVGNTPFDLIDFSGKRNILIEAYSPVAHGAALNDQNLADMAENMAWASHSCAFATACSSIFCRCRRRRMWSTCGATPRWTLSSLTTTWRH